MKMNVLLSAIMFFDLMRHLTLQGQGSSCERIHFSYDDSGNRIKRSLVVEDPCTWLNGGDNGSNARMASASGIFMESGFSAGIAMSGSEFGVFGGANAGGGLSFPGLGLSLQVNFHEATDEASNNLSSINGTLKTNYIGKDKIMNLNQEISGGLGIVNASLSNTFDTQNKGFYNPYNTTQPERTASFGLGVTPIGFDRTISSQGNNSWNVNTELDLRFFIGLKIGANFGFKRQ